MNKLEIFRFKKMLRKEDRKKFQELIDDYKRLLEQEPCKDVISRAEALKVVDDKDIPEDMSEFEIKIHIGVEIGTLPPVTPTRDVRTKFCPDCGSQNLKGE